MPTLVRYERQGDEGKVVEVGRLVEAEILEEGRLEKLIA